MKPELPSVQGITWVKAYNPSGICPSSAILLMIGVAALVGIIAGAIGYVGGFAVSWLTIIGLSILAFSAKFGGAAGLLAMIVFVIVIPIGVGIGYPALLGYGVGVIFWRLAKQGKCRNVSITRGIAVLCGMIAYGVFAWLAVGFGGGIHETSRMTQQLLTSQFSTSGWMYLIVAVDAIVLILAVFAKVGNYVSETPFCEECNQWYQKPIKAVYPVELAEPLFTTLDSGIPQDLGGKSELPPNAKVPRLALTLQRCSCNKTEYKLSATLLWQETNKEQKVVDMTQDWFTTMIPAILGRQIGSILF